MSFGEASLLLAPVALLAIATYFGVMMLQPPFRGSVSDLSDYWRHPILRPRFFRFLIPFLAAFIIFAVGRVIYGQSA